MRNALNDNWKYFMLEYSCSIIFTILSNKYKFIIQRKCIVFSAAIKSMYIIQIYPQKKV